MRDAATVRPLMQPAAQNSALESAAVSIGASRNERRPICRREQRWYRLQTTVGGVATTLPRVTRVCQRQKAGLSSLLCLLLRSLVHTCRVQRRESQKPPSLAWPRSRGTTPRRLAGHSLDVPSHGKEGRLELSSRCAQAAADWHWPCNASTTLVNVIASFVRDDFNAKGVSGGVAVSSSSSFSSSDRARRSLCRV